MKPHNRSWLVASGAAVGLVVVGAAALKRLRREERRQGAEHPQVEGRPAKNREAATHGVTESGSRMLRGRDMPEMSRPLRQAINASRRVQGLPPPIPEKIYSEFVERADEQRATAREDRQEVSALVPPRAIAPSPGAAGAELADAGAIELPVGQSADAEIDRALSRAGLPEPNSTGAALHRAAGSDGLHEEAFPLVAKKGTPEPEYSAIPAGDSMRTDDAYDAVAPDDLGSEWLARATEANSGGVNVRREFESPEILLESGMSVVSEGSLNASQADAIESRAALDLDDDPDVIVLDDLPSDPVDTNPNSEWIGERRSRVSER